MSDIKRLYEDLKGRLYQDKTIAVHFNLSGATAFMPFKFHSYKLYDDNKSIEITSMKDDTVFTLDLTQIKDCIRYEQEEDTGYTISFDSWSVDVVFMGGLE